MPWHFTSLRVLTSMVYWAALPLPAPLCDTSYLAEMALTSCMQLLDNCIELNCGYLERWQDGMRTAGSGWMYSEGRRQRRHRLWCTSPLDER